MCDQDKKCAYGKVWGGYWPGAQIGKDLVLPHHSGVVIHGNVKIGENVIIRQNTTIGEKESDSRENYNRYW